MGAPLLRGLFQEIADVVSGYSIAAGVDDLRPRFAVVQRPQRIHRLPPHLERTLSDECRDVARLEQLQLRRERVGRDRRQLAALEAVGIAVYPISVAL